MLKVALAQINPTVGDLDGNVDLIRQAIRQARQDGADLLVTPELCLNGYPPEDLVLREDFLAATESALERLRSETTGLTLVVGHLAGEGALRFNAATVLQDGQQRARYLKLRLPNDSVFDEVRYFCSGGEPVVVEVAGHRVGIVICADVWEGDAVGRSRQAGAELVVALNASPFHVDKQEERYAIVRERIRESGVPLVYVNAVGGQDELVFDGASFGMSRDGTVQLQAPAFSPAQPVICFTDGDVRAADQVPLPDTLAGIYKALVLGVRDYVTKNGFPGVILGLSGGIDSALTLVVAVDALGPERVRAVMMPSPYTAPMSVEDARTLANRAGVCYDEVDIWPVYQGFADALAPLLAGTRPDLTEENLQARIRGTLLMALSNKLGPLVLTTGNKSEMAVGYATLYGDMAGGFAVLKDVPKTLVYALANWRNAQAAVIPERIITRAPSAELRPGQLDQDSLPPYEVLDAIIQAYVEEDASVDQIVAGGQNYADVIKVIRLIDRNEYKRRQSPIGIRITRRAFGKDRRYPVTNRFHPDSTAVPPGGAENEQGVSE